MSKPKTNLMSSAVTKLVMITVFCCLLTYNATTLAGDSRVFESLGLAVLLVDAVVFVGWLIMALYVIWAGKTLPAMNPKAAQILDRIEFGLFLYWIVVWFWIKAIAVWVIPVLWLAWIASVVVAIKVK